VECRESLPLRQGRLPPLPHRQQEEAVNPGQQGTKAAAVYQARIEPGDSAEWRLRLTNTPPEEIRLHGDFEAVFHTRREEADEFFAKRVSPALSVDGQHVQRQALAGLLWSKQFYHYDVRTWASGDPANPLPSGGRKHPRNLDWSHLYNEDIISMPDKWEYPWYAAWDLAFHCIPLALVDPDFAKE